MAGARRNRRAGSRGCGAASGAADVGDAPNDMAVPGLGAIHQGIEETIATSRLLAF